MFEFRNEDASVEKPMNAIELKKDLENARASKYAMRLLHCLTPIGEEA